MPAAGDKSTSAAESTAAGSSSTTRDRTGKQVDEAGVLFHVHGCVVKVSRMRELEVFRQITARNHSHTGVVYFEDFATLSRRKRSARSAARLLPRAARMPARNLRCQQPRTLTTGRATFPESRSRAPTASSSARLCSTTQHRAPGRARHGPERLPEPDQARARTPALHRGRSLRRSLGPAHRHELHAPTCSRAPAPSSL